MVVANVLVRFSKLYLKYISKKKKNVAIFEKKATNCWKVNWKYRILLKKNCFYKVFCLICLQSEPIAKRCSVKKVFLEILQSS